MVIILFRKIRNKNVMRIQRRLPFMEHPSDSKNNHYIVEGTTGKEVEELQMMLLELSHIFPSIPVLTAIDGYYGNETKSVVKEFQSLNSLPTTGEVDNMTWKKIKEFLESRNKNIQINTTTNNIDLSEDIITNIDE